MDLWLITVNFVNTKLTKQLIDSLTRIDVSNSLKIGIADNASSSKSVEKLNQIKNNSKLDISIFFYKQNYYYWPAAKKVFTKMRKKYKKLPDWILICNNDVTFPDKLFFKKLKEINSKKYPIIGPDIIGSNENKLNPFMISTLSWVEKCFWWMYFKSYTLSLILLKLKSLRTLFLNKSKKHNQSFPQKVYAIHGSAILFSGEYFNRGGWLDDNFEMFGEEMSVAEIAKYLKMPVTYCPNLEIIHHEHSITKNTDKKILYKKAKESYKYIKSAYLK